MSTSRPTGVGLKRSSGVASDLTVTSSICTHTVFDTVQNHGAI